MSNNEILDIYKNSPIFILEGNGGGIAGSYFSEPTVEQMDIDYAKYLHKDKIDSGSSEYNCVLYRIVVGKSVEAWNGKYNGSRYNWTSNGPF